MQTYSKQSSVHAKREETSAGELEHAGLTGNQALLAANRVLHEALGQSRRERSIPGDLRANISKRLRVDLSGVRAYETPQLEETTGELAVTRGGEMIFQSGSFNPGTEAGRAMITHEMTHVAQQGLGLVSGSGVVTNPALEAAADIGSLGGAPTAGFTMPASGVSAPVQGFGGLKKLLSGITGRRRKSGQSGDTARQPNVQNNMSGSSGQIINDPVQLPGDQPVNNDEIEIYGDDSINIEQSNPDPDKKTDDSVPSEDKDIYEVEKHFIPSPDSGMFKKMTLEKSMDTKPLVELLTKTRSVQSMTERADNRLFRGMDKDGERKKDPNNKKDENFFPISKKHIQTYKDYFADGGDHTDVFKQVDAGNGIGDNITLTYHAKVENKDFTKIKTKRMIKGKTSFARPKLIPLFWASVFTKSGGKKFNDKIKRSVVLDMMQARSDVQEAHLSRKALKVIYEKAYDEIKQEKRPSDTPYKTGLDFNPEWLPEPQEGEKEGRKRITEDMKAMSLMECGHTWIETKSDDKDGKDRVRFTMGFWPELGSSNTFEKVPGEVRNPDNYDASAGNYQQAKDIGKQQYLSALKFAKDFRSVYSLAGTSGANCTSFATKLAKKVGMSVESGQRTVRGTVHSPDIVAKKINAIPESEYTKKQGGYKEFDLPGEADIDDKTAGDLLLKACQKTEKFTQAFRGLTAYEAEAGKIVLRDRLTSELKNAYELKRVYVLKDLHEYSKSDNPSDTLTAFVETILDLVTPSLSDESAQKAAFEEERKKKTKAFKDAYRSKKSATRVAPTAKDLFSFFDSNKDTLQSELIKSGFLNDSWSDSAYADKISRAFVIAIESQMLISNDLNQLYETEMIQGSMDVGRFVNKCKSLKSGTAVKNEFNSVLFQFISGNKNTDKAYSELYF